MSTPPTTTPARWPDVSRAHQEELAQLAARYVRWPHPELVAQVAAANADPAWQAECEAGLAAAMDPALYVWAGSTCLFPGIRRFKNSRNPVERANSGARRGRWCSTAPPITLRRSVGNY